MRQLRSRGSDVKTLLENTVAHSNYSDERMTGDETRVLDTSEFRLALYDARRCDGDGRASSGEGPSLSTLFERSLGGDWSWKPERDRAMGYGNDSTFKTFLGVPKSAAEMHRGQVFARS